MELTPRKSISLRATPKNDFISKGSDHITKNVKFSIGKGNKTYDIKGKENKFYKAEDVLSMLNDSSLSEDAASSDEEWIVTKSKALSITDSPAIHKSDVNFTGEATTPSKNLGVKVSPLKLLRKSEYEVNKVPSSNKKSESSVSPIVIKRKTDKRLLLNVSSLPLTSSSKLNTSELNSLEHSSPSIIRPKRRSVKKPARYDSDTENECSPAKKKTPEKNKRTVKNSSQNVNERINEESKTIDVSSDSEDISLADRIKLPSRKSSILPNAPSTPNLTKKAVTPRTSARKKTELPFEVISDSCPVSPDLIVKSRTPRASARNKLVLLSSPASSEVDDESDLDFLTSIKQPRISRASARKKLELSSPLVSEVQDPPSLRRQVITPRRSVRKKLELNSPKTNEKYYEEDSSSDQSEEIKTPKRKSKVFRNSVVDSPSLRRQVLTPRHSAKKKLDLSSPGNKKKMGSGFLSPVVQERTKRNLSGTPTTRLDATRANLHTCNVPTSLPCREKEFNNILTFTIRKIEDRAGGCMYISGVPGTGKTATVHAVIKLLQDKADNEELSTFNFIEVNGLRLTEPRQAYTRLWQELSGNKCSPELALTELEKKFTKKCKHSTVILVDELDYLCNRRQDVIYNILEWSTKATAALTVITIANTMDLPERTLKGKVTSRMGLTRLVFQPYTFQQLQQIVLNRIGSNSNFHVDAVQLVARKVAAVSGDARRALDICRRATELISSDVEIVKVSHIEKALDQIFAGTRVQAIKKCSIMNQLLLRAMRDEFHRTGVEETTIGQVFSHFSAIASLEGLEAPPIGLLLNMSSALADSGLILAEKSRSDLNRKLSLNVSPDDIHYALSC